MVNIAHIVEKIISEKPFLQEALARGIVNHSALAEELIPEIEKDLKKKVKFSAVNMAIRRLSEKLDKSFIVNAKFDENTDISIRSDLVEIPVFKMEDVQDHIKELYGIVNFRKGDFLTVTQGLHEMMIITNKRHEKKVIEIFPKKCIKQIINDLSSITINIPDESLEEVGLFYLITRALTWENINIIDIVSTLNEMTFIIREEDTSRAYDCLKNLISNNTIKNMPNKKNKK
jgi:aspartokinase